MYTQIKMGRANRPPTGFNMMFVANDNHDPRTNLALEEFLLRHVLVEETLFLFYVNEPAVIIGRNQNAFEEVDPDYLAANGIQLLRRLSGGGTVYHDLGNLNFSFISPDRSDLHNFAKFTDPIVAVLGDLGLKAELRNRSSLFVGDKKISGNAQYASRGRVLSHGTLLFAADLDGLDRAVRPRPLPIESKAVQSVRADVANITDLLPRPMTMAQFQEAILRHLFGAAIPTYRLSEDDWTQIEQIRAERYQSWDWNIGRSPRFTIHKSGQLPAGQMTVHVEVVAGRIQHVNIAADFLDQRTASRLADCWHGQRFDRPALADALQAAGLLTGSGSTLWLEILDLVA